MDGQERPKLIVGVRKYVSDLLLSHHKKARLEVIEEIERELEPLREVYDDDVDSRNDKYRFEGHNRALSTVRELLNSKKGK